MDKRPGYKTWNYKTLRKKHSCKAFDLGLGNCFLDMTPKSQVTKDKIDELHKQFCPAKDTIKKVKKTIHRMKEKYLQIIYLIKDFYPDI